MLSMRSNLLAAAALAVCVFAAHGGSLFDGLFPATSREYITLKDFFEDLNETSCPLN